MFARYRVEYAMAAQTDVARLHAFIAVDSPRMAEAFVDRLIRQIATLDRFPRRFPVIPEAAGMTRRYRHLVAGNYRTIFRVDGHTVFVVRIVHGARRLVLKDLE